MTTRWVAAASVAGLVLAGCGGTTKTHTAAPPSTSGASPTSAAAGKVVFTGSAGCGHCHTLAAARTTGVLGPNLETSLRSDCATPASKRIRGATLQKCIYSAITNPYAYIPSGYQAGIMPPGYGQGLTSTQLQALVTFLASAAK